MNFVTQAPVITLDGPSGTGKGTLCHQLAAILGWHFLDSGAIYRILAYAARTKGIDFHAIDQLVAAAAQLDFSFEAASLDKTLVFLEKTEISEAIRTEQCGQDASRIAATPEVRQALLERQRVFARQPGLVTDGRDMGTVVFPDARLKIYLFASPEERAKRRYLQLKKQGIDATLAHVANELTERDARDTQRSHAPLKPAEDAISIDTTGLTIEQVMQRLLHLVTERGLLPAAQ